MSLIAKVTAISDLGLFIPSLRKILLNGWDDYTKLYSDSQRVIHCPNTRAAIVHDHQIDHASRFASENGFQLLNLSEMKVLIIGSYAIRFKKLTNELISRNQPTKQVTEFREQQSLEGFSETYNLEAGYVLNESRTEITKTCLVQPSGKGISWEIEMLDNENKSVVADIFEQRALAETDETEGATIRGKESNVTPIRKIENED